jgi:hypothetical protein
MAETNPTTTNEFTDVITESSTIPNISPNSPEFVTVTTETTIITSSSSESSENDSELETPRNLIKQYDELFTTPEEYNNKNLPHSKKPFKSNISTSITTDIETTCTIFVLNGTRPRNS